MAVSKPVTIEVVGELISKPYIEITLNLMRRFGVTVEQDGWASFTVQPGQKYQSPGSIHVEGDASSASYFLAAGAIAGGPVRVEGVGKDSASRATCASPTRWSDGRDDHEGRQLDRGEVERRAEGHRRRLQPYPGRRDDDRRGRAVRRRHEHAAQHRQLAREGNRPPGRDGDELRKVGATVEEGADYIRVTPPETVAGDDRHL
jgi:3-phosphoshikimate 1-carboxyvinyltransferase